MPETSARLPALTNVESPRPRFLTFSRMAEPRAPDWQKNPARPRGGRTARQGGVERPARVGVDDAQAVRADQAQSVGPGQPDQATLALPALLAGLGEARGDHHQPVDALGGAVEHHVLDGVGGDGHDRQVDVAGDVAHGGVRRQARHRLGDLVDGVHPTGEVAHDQVAHQRLADRVLTAAGPDHGHRLRVEEPLDRGSLGAVLPPGHHAPSPCRSGRSGTPAASRPLRSSLTIR